MSDEIKMAEQRELLGIIVRAVWITWARQQPNCKPSWITPWYELSESDKEVDRQIGEALFQAGYAKARQDLGKTKEVMSVNPREKAPPINELTSPEIPVESTGATPATATEVKSVREQWFEERENDLVKTLSLEYRELYYAIRKERDAAIRKEERLRAYRECASIVLNNFCPSNDRGYAAQQTAQAILAAMNGEKEGGGE